MKLWKSRTVAAERCDRSLRHEFLIGPLCNTSLFPKEARVYYCFRCKWSFLVCGSKVAVLDEDGSLLAGAESLRRFNTLEEGPCPVLEAFVSAPPLDAHPLEPQFRRKFDEPGYLASRHVRTGSGRPGPVLRVLSRVREDLGR
jgi:hypothetical protein